MTAALKALTVATTILAVIGADGQMFAASDNAMKSQSSQSPSATMQDDHPTGMMLGRVKDPKQTLSKASVDDASGTEVGQVQSVTTFRSGRARSIMVSLSGQNKTVAIPARDLRYVKSTNTLDAKLTETQIDGLASHT